MDSVQWGHRRLWWGELEEDNCVFDWAAMDIRSGSFRLSQYLDSHQSSYSVFRCLSELESDHFTAFVKKHLEILLSAPMEEDVDVFHTTKSDRVTPAETHRQRFGLFGSSSGSGGNSNMKGTRKDEFDNKAILPLSRQMAKSLNSIITFLGHEKNLQREDLFIKKCSRERELELFFSMFNDRAMLNLDSSESPYDAYVCATVLLKTLAYLNDPLLTEDLFHLFCNIAGLFVEKVDQMRKIEALQSAFLLLPDENRNLFRRFLFLLHLVSLECEVNGMNSSNLARIFAEILFYPRTMSVADWNAKSDDMVGILKFMIDYATQLFRVPAALLSDLVTLLKERKERKDNGEREEVVRTNLTFSEHERPDDVGSDVITAEPVFGTDIRAASLPESLWSRLSNKKFKKENRKARKSLNGKPKRSLRSTLKKWFCCCCNRTDDVEECYEYSAHTI